MMVTILNFDCVGHYAEETGSFHVKINLYQLVMGCKMFHHKAVISVQSLKRNDCVTVSLFEQCIGLIF